MSDTTGQQTSKQPPGKDGPPQGPVRPGGGILMGRPFGVPIYVTPTWFLIAGLITWIFGGQLANVLPGLGATRYLVALSFAIAFYGSVLVHELAHTLVALRYKLGVRRIQLQFLGGISEIEREAETPGREFWLAFVGPLLSLVLGGICWGALQFVETDTVPGVLIAGLAVSNLVVAVFNLLPGLPLDGGRMLRAVVWGVTGRPMAGTVAAAWAGRVLALAVLFGLPAVSAARGGNRSSGDALLDTVLAAVLAVVIWNGAGAAVRNARLKAALPGLTLRSLTRRAVSVSADTPLAEALRQAREAQAGAVLVVDGYGEPAALVKEAAVLQVPEQRRPWVAVGALARSLEPGMRLAGDLSGEDLLNALRATPASEYLVVEADGSVYGVLAVLDVERRLTAAVTGR
ncbi:Zn-dependent protease/CBS domain-containing protein [Kitasatospora sp. MAP12-15]|uniref:site-2 protease family protein n=1 Tax=unclassified Kitasatospora TaxID=2633591 RepID=UPI00247568F5|nr:site-2 protease family protein [Kitasatospora sp. MAP12-44]MDH6109577.1 Zn-dependent protease/CBS domain-containing protein [Kitasatospora sp. MAP12-44]